MAMAFTRVSWWLLEGGGKDNHPKETTSSACPPTGASPDFGFRDTENVNSPLGRGAKVRSVRPRRKWRSREERCGRVDRELDLVLVPSDGEGVCRGPSRMTRTGPSGGWSPTHLGSSATAAVATWRWRTASPCWYRAMDGDGATGVPPRAPLTGTMASVPSTDILLRE